MNKDCYKDIHAAAGYCEIINTMQQELSDFQKQIDWMATADVRMLMDPVVVGVLVTRCHVMMADDESQLLSWYMIPMRLGTSYAEWMAENTKHAPLALGWVTTAAKIF